MLRIDLGLLIDSINWWLIGIITFLLSHKGEFNFLLINLIIQWSLNAWWIQNVGTLKIA